VAVRLEKIGKHWQQTIADILELAFADLEVEYGEELAIRAGIGDDGHAARIGDDDGPRYGIVGMSAKDDVDARDHAREFQIDVHSVVRQQHNRIDPLDFAHANHMLL